MKSFALYKSQGGSPLRVSLLAPCALGLTGTGFAHIKGSKKLIEQLTGASSLFSASERIVLLRNFGISGIVTAVVWLLSPLGGQALSPRLLSKQHFHSSFTQNATFWVRISWVAVHWIRGPEPRQYILV